MITIPKQDEFNQIIASFDGEECYWCARDEPCHCKKERVACKCSCGVCCAPFGEVLSDTEL